MNATGKSYKNIGEHYQVAPPVDAKGNRLRGSSTKDAYWAGVDGAPERGERGSNTRMAYDAGRIEYLKERT